MIDERKVNTRKPSVINFYHHQHRLKHCAYVFPTGHKYAGQTCGATFIAGSGFARYCDLHKAAAKQRKNNAWKQKQKRLRKAARMRKERK